jgi:hypothetical protein
MSTTTKTESLHWVQQPLDSDDKLARLIFGHVFACEIGFDDTLWIERQGGEGAEWALSHNTREIGRHKSFQEAKRAAAEYFSTL